MSASTTPGDSTPRSDLPTDVPIVVMASACWETPAPVNVHQIARRFARRGHRVLFVESTGMRSPAAGSAHDLGRIRRRLADWRRGLREAEPRLFVLSALALPWGWPKPARRLSMRWIASAVRRAARRLGMERPVLWTFLPTHLTVADALPHRVHIYQCVDHYAANPGVDRPWIEALESRMLERADLVFATSDVLADRLRGSRDDVELLPNVADVELFSRAQTEDGDEPAELRRVPRPRAVYVGNLAAYRIDIDVLDRLAAALDEVQFVFIGAVGLGDVEGPSGVLRRLMDRLNVHAIGAKPHAALPDYLRFCDVALIPFLDNEHTRGSLPLKLWEYVAAGLPVVATDLPNFREPAEEGVVRCARGVDGFANAIRAALDRSGDQRAHRLQVARRHDWSRRIDRLSELIAGASA